MPFHCEEGMPEEIVSNTGEGSSKVITIIFNEGGPELVVPKVALTAFGKGTPSGALERTSSATFAFFLAANPLNSSCRFLLIITL
jgi:hypothetical protein